MKISVLTNNLSRDGYASEHGLSIFIKHELYNILFDVGYTDVFIKNAKKLNVDLNKVEYIVLSHGHYDHTGGLRFLDSCKSLQHIYIHKDAFIEKYAKEQKNRYNGIPFKENDLVLTSKHLYKTEGFSEIKPKFYLLSDVLHNNKNTKYYVGDKLDDFHDESILILEENNELSLFMGCSHFGVVNGVEAVKEIFPNKKIKNLIAGMHLSSKSIEEVDLIGKKLFNLGIQKIYPMHCTGEKAIKYFKEKYNDSCIIIKAGDQIEI
ncbi:MBL fold metallo-hydrolase [Candidatus Izemoplasma sp. B36]|uniref:MBL fold metallo-hydrolase n=1 Tax=Candidatus Izemoplasma sp. B36 TaxID=3242468 RepID=UPI003557AA0D